MKVKRNRSLRERKTRKPRKKNRTKKYIRGGEAIDSGGYGCVFQPALKCKSLNPNATISQNTKNISKLMSTQDAKEEYAILQKFANIIKYSHKTDMFRFMVLSGITMCQVSPTQYDIDQYNKNCGRLVEKNGMNNISGLMALNIPYAGKNLLKMFNELRLQNSPINKRIVIEYFKKMRVLFQEGVLLLYETKPKIIHGDLKEENILCQYNESFTNIYDEIKLIDWGLSFTYDEKNNPKEAIRQLSRRPLQFNLPFGILLFSKYFDREYTSMVLTPLKNNQNNPKSLIDDLVIQFCNSYYNDSFFTKGKDDSKPNVLKDFYNFVYLVMGEANVSILEMSLTDYIRLNLSKILIKYTKYTSEWTWIFDKESYAYEYYLPMVDTYGFILTYCNVLSYLLHARKNSFRISNQPNIDSLILSITEQLKLYCFVFDERIDGNTYRIKVSQSINKMTNLCIDLLK